MKEQKEDENDLKKLSKLLQSFVFIKNDFLPFLHKFLEMESSEIIEQNISINEINLELKNASRLVESSVFKIVLSELKSDINLIILTYFYSELLPEDLENQIKSKITSNVEIG